MIKIIAFGKCNKDISSQIYEYSKRLRNIEIREVKKIPEFKDTDYVIACSEEGTEFSSREFSDMITSVEGKNIVFVIGPAEGLDDKIKKKTDMILSLSKMTFPHEMFRLFLVEQIYRAHTIKKGINYHK